MDIIVALQDWIIIIIYSKNKYCISVWFYDNNNATTTKTKQKLKKKKDNKIGLCCE